MKKIVLLPFFFAITIIAGAQISLDVLSTEPDSLLQGIKVQRIAGDKNSTSFVIWIKDAVKAHKHITHTENIYVLEGEGEMKLKGKIIKIKPGDYVNIPENTVHSVKVTSTAVLKVLSIQSPEFLGEDRVFMEE